MAAVRPLGAVLIAIVANAIVSATWGSHGASTLGVTFSISMFLPQAAKVLRESGSGVSPATWWLALSTSTLWFIGGVLIDKFVLVAPISS